MTQSVRIVVFLCLAGSAAFGQMDHMHMHGMMAPPSEANMSSTNNGVTATLQMVPSFADCVAGAQCWHGSSVYPLAATQVFSSNGFMFAIDANHAGYEFANNAWTKHQEWGDVYGLQADASGNIYALFAKGGCTSGYELGTLNGSGWTLDTYCFNQFFVSPNANFLLIDPNGVLWWNIGAGWVHAPSPNNYPVVSAAWLQDGLTFIEVTNDHQIWEYDGANWGQPVGGSCCALSVSADPSQTWYVTGTDSNLYHYNGSNGFDKLAYSGGTIGTGYGGFSNGGSMQVWAVGPNVNGNTLYRFSDQAVQFQRGAHGSISCTPIPPFNESVCNSFTHTIRWYAGWGGLHGNAGSTSTVGQQTFNGPGGWNVSANANLDNVFDALENPQNYAINESGTTECSGDGQLYSDPGPSSTSSLISYDYGQYDPGGTYVLGASGKSVFPLSYPGCPTCQPPFVEYYREGVCDTSRACQNGTWPSHPSIQLFSSIGYGTSQAAADQGLGKECHYAGPNSNLGIKYETIFIPVFDVGVTFPTYRQVIPGYCS